MRIHLPDGLAARAPLVVVLHGCGQTADGYAAGSGWITLADRFGFALLCPEQTRNNNGNLCFNWFEPGDIARASGDGAPGGSVRW
jgi:poly(hydroxyalkanoate) depolymerase family esterase